MGSRIIRHVIVVTRSDDKILANTKRYHHRLGTTVTGSLLLAGTANMGAINAVMERNLGIKKGYTVIKTEKILLPAGYIVQVLVRLDSDSVLPESFERTHYDRNGKPSKTITWAWIEQDKISAEYKEIITSLLA